MSESLQVWVRNDKGQVYGPLTPPSVELLIDNGVISGRLQVSTDGLNYVYPGRVPGLRVIFPRETWGDTIIPGDELDAQWGQVVVPAPLGGGGPAAAPGGGPFGGAGAPIAGPGIANAPTAGSGVRPGPGIVRPGPGPGRPVATVVPASRPPPTVSPQANAASHKPLPSVADFFAAATGVNPAASARTAGGASAAPPASSSSGVRSPASSGSGLRSPASSGSGLRAAPLPTASVGDLKMPGSGDLSETSAPRLYCIAAATEATGLLTLKLSDRELVVHFRKGNAEFLDSTHREDTLDTFLVSQGLATADQVKQAQAQASRFGGELLPSLFGLGLLNPNAVFQHLGQRASALLTRALSADQGTFTFDLEDLPTSKAMPLGNKWRVYLEAMRRVPIVDVRLKLRGVIDNPVMKGAGRVLVSDMRINPQETRALTYFDGVRSLNQLTGELAGEADHILRTAWMLMPLELVTFAGVTLTAPKAAPPPKAVPPPAAPAPPRPAAPPAPVISAAPVSAPVIAPPPAAAAPAPAAPPKPSTVPGPPVAATPGAAPGNPVNASRPAAAPYPGGAGQRPPPPVMNPPGAPAAAPARPAPPQVNPPAPSSAPAPSPANVAVELKQLQETYEAMKGSNFFDVLGVKREADANAVKIAYLKAARSYHPDTVPPGSPEALVKVKADIFALIGDANRTLSDAALRATYVAELDAGGAGEKVDVEKLLRAEELFQKGRILVQNRKTADAVKMLEEAITCNPDEAEFYAWRGYAKYLSATDRKAVQVDVMRDLNLCIAKNPNVAAVYYFMGYIQKANGDEKAALANFKKCVSLDPRHIDAAREVRMATQKK